MRKRYLFLLMLLFPLATILSSNRAYAQTDAEYNAACAAIEDGFYYIVTEVNETKWYVTAAGTLVDDISEGELFDITKVMGGDFKTFGFRISSDNERFTNPTLSNNTANLSQNFYAHSTGDRDGWERQVLFMNDEGKIAIRSCNTAYGTTSWNDAGRTFWTYKVADVPTPCYTYDPTYVWVLEDEEGNVVEPPTDAAKVYATLLSIVNKYETQLYGDEEGEDMNIGTGFGQYSDKESWDKLYAHLWEVYELVEGSFDPDNNFEWIGDGECPTFEEAKDMAAKADELYQKILESIVQYTMPQDGYYRIITNLLYTKDKTVFVDKAIAASYSKDHLNKGVYETLDRSKANFLWKLTKSESGDSIMIQNAGMGTYLSFASPNENRFVMTNDKADASYVMFDYAGKDFVENSEELGEGEDKDIFYIRLASMERGDSYAHQLGHGVVSDAGTFLGHAGADSGTEMELCFWAPTFEKTNTDRGTSEWYLEYVPDEEAEELIEAFEIIRDHDILVTKNNELRAKVLEALTTAKDAIKTEMITSADQLSSPNSDPSEGKNIGALIDGDASTFWHTSWHSGENSSTIDYKDKACHYVLISGMEELVGDCELYWREREGADNDRPTKVVLLGSESEDTPDEEWAEMAVIDITNTGKGEESFIPFNLETAYPYIRLLAVEVNSSFRTFWHAAEIQLYTVSENPNSQYVALGDVAKELDRIYNENVAVADEDITLELYQALLDAFDAFNTSMVDPTELRNALATYANLTKSVVEGSNPGQWKDVSIATGFDNLYNEVKTYDEAGKYTAVQNHKYAVMLKAMSKSVMEQVNGVKTDKWYHIMFPTEEMYTDYGFDPAVVGGDSKIVDDPNMWGYYVVPGIRTDEMGTNDEGQEAATGKYFLEVANAETSRAGMSMYFANPDEIEDADLSMFRFIEQEAEDTDYSSLFQETKENMLMALDMSTTYTKGEALITDASQLSSNASDPNEGLHIEYLIDGNPNTFWHSDYHKKFLEPGYIQVKLNEPVSGLIQVDITRRQGASNGHVVRMYIQGSNDAENWTNVGYLETPFTNQNESVTSAPVDLDGTYSYLRFTMTYRYGTDSGGNMEFDPFAVITSEDEYNSKWTYFHAAEFQIYPVTADKELSTSGKTLQTAYKTLNKIILKDATARDVSSAAQAYRAYRDDFNTAEGKSVLPKGKDKVDPVYAIQNKATGLFVNCQGSNNANNSLEIVPTLFTYQALGYQRSLMHGKMIGGYDCSYLHSQNFDHRFVTWNATAANSNSGLVICEADVAYEVPESFTFCRDIQPGKIYNWCSSVTITPAPSDDAAAYTCLGRYQNDEGDFLALKQIDVIPAGQPAFYIFGDTLEYDAEDDYVEPVKFTIPADEKLVMKADTINGLIGILGNHSLKENQIYFSGNHPVCIGSTGYRVYAPKWGAVLDLPCTNVDPEEVYDFSICLDKEGESADGVKDVAATIQKISQPGAVYSMDGKLLRTNATLNSLKSLGKGMYILNGVKVLVK